MVAREIDRLFTYAFEDVLEIGQVVSVPFRNTDLLGIVCARNTTFTGQAKPISHVFPYVLKLEFLSFIQNCARYNMLPVGQVVKMCLPFSAKDLSIKEGKETGIKQEGIFQSAQLSEKQEEAAQALLRETFHVSVLDGVTGSGKTEVYLKAIHQAFEKGLQSLILLPEIGLTAQWIERFERRFGFTPLVWHSSVSKAKKRDIWRYIAHGRAGVVVGARSALFLPFQKLGMIVVDEEHDNSFKQDEQGCYQGRDMAVLRAKYENIPITLSSATPSLETVHNMRQKKYEHVMLLERFGEAQMPTLQIVDLKTAPVGQWITKELDQAIRERLEKKQQILLFLNRRGYAPLTLCRTCGHRFMCPGCDAWLVEHRMHTALVCHHCGFQQKIPSNCPSCAATAEHLMPCGPGVERITEHVLNTYPDARALAITSDLMSTPEEMFAAIAMVEAGAVDILIGTQMLAKGHHFKNLTLVGVIDGDMGLSGGDLRANERTFQLLHQVGGRAGREAEPGHVIIQTHATQAPLMQALLTAQRDAFFDMELAEREADHMPPWSRLVAVVLSSLHEETVKNAARTLARTYQPHEGVTLLGPAVAPIAKIRGRYRWRFLLRADKNVNIQSIVHDWTARTPLPGTVRLNVDVDPYYFM